MKILIYGVNYSPELTGIGKYSGEMARWLAEQGYDVRVVTAPPYYPDWKIWQGYSSWSFSKRLEEGVTVIRCPLYVPSQPTALKRLLHLTSFSLSSSIALLAQLFWKPKLIVLIVPTLFCSPQALLFGKLTGAKSVLHIQDYEVDAFFGLGFAQGNGLRRFTFAIERLVLRAFDRVSTISRGMLFRAQQKGVAEERLLFLPNWSETERFQNVSSDTTFLNRLGVDSGKRIVLYSGNIGEKQGLEGVVDAAERLSSRSELMFLIVGEGAGKARLVELVKKKSLDNVKFAPLQSYDDLPKLLASADVHLVIQKRGAADVVLPSKLTNILAVGGNAVITTDPDTSLGLLCKEHSGIAYMIEPESVEALIQGINYALLMPRPNRLAQKYARDYLDKEGVLKHFIKDVTESI